MVPSDSHVIGKENNSSGNFRMMKMDKQTEAYNFRKLPAKNVKFELEANLENDSIDTSPTSDNRAIQNSLMIGESQNIVTGIRNHAMLESSESQSTRAKKKTSIMNPSETDKNRFLDERCRSYSIEEQKDVYTDFASVPMRTVASSSDYCETKKGGVMVLFPVKLHKILNLYTRFESPVLSWAPHGRSFIIRNPREFTQSVMPLFFDHSNFASFQRQLNLYGFKRMTKLGSSDEGSYYHELFLHGRPDLCELMRRTKIKGCQKNHPRNIDKSEPNFYKMPCCVPADDFSHRNINGTFEDQTIGSAESNAKLNFQSPLQHEIMIEKLRQLDRAVYYQKLRCEELNPQQNTNIFDFYYGGDKLTGIPITRPTISGPQNFIFPSISSKLIMYNRPGNFNNGIRSSSLFHENFKRLENLYLSTNSKKQY